MAADFRKAQFPRQALRSNIMGRDGEEAMAGAVLYSPAPQCPKSLASKTLPPVRLEDRIADLRSQGTKERRIGAPRLFVEADMADNTSIYAPDDGPNGPGLETSVVYESFVSQIDKIRDLAPRFHEDAS